MESGCFHEVLLKIETLETPEMFVLVSSQGLLNYIFLNKDYILEDYSSQNEKVSFFKSMTYS